MLREIILDTETTGFHSKGADRIIEIACLEVIDKRPTEKTFHAYINPKRDVPFAATKVHNITTDFLKGKPFFENIAQGFLDFIEDSKLIIHNAPFDMGFLNAELERASLSALHMSKAIDTLAIARQKFPGANNTLDGLCKRFKIDLSNRNFHGALIDCELLAQVYVELLGGRQKTFSFSNTKILNHEYGVTTQNLRKNISARDFHLTEDEKNNHNELLKEIKNPLWEKVS
ncbi:MAG: DNA polymerase III subunit epsilon [Proteobacteria bacterium]|nr:DNA polymerase III subunit epsilon [Pseudomonadota bacterium]